MRGSHRASPALLILAVLSACTVGCGPPVPQGASKPSDRQAGATRDDQYQASDLSVNIGEYMPPLEGGKLEIASPENWDWARPGRDYVVGFVPHGSKLNSLPRILVSAEECPYPDIRRVSKDNVQEFAQAVSASIAGQEVAKPVRPLILGDNVFACYVTFAKSKNAVVSRQILETVVEGRRYIVRLEVYERQFDKYRDAAYAVAMSMKYQAGGDSPPPEVEEPADAPPAAGAGE